MSGDEIHPLREGDPPKPEMRVSDQERAQVTRTLAAAAGDGRLTRTELEERLEAALSARTSGELGKLTADLPETRATRAQVVRLDFHGGGTRRRGQWAVPRRMEIRAKGGSLTLDFAEAVLANPTLDIDVQMSGGRLLLLTRPGIDVDIDQLSARGGRVKVRPEPRPKEAVSLMIRISGVVQGGQVVVRPQRPWRRRKHVGSTAG